MRFSARFLPACLAALLMAWVAASAGCDYTKPVMYIDIVNRSGHPMENLEVNYPTGSFGMPELRNGQTRQYLAPIGAPCKFTVSFSDQTGKAYTGSYDLGTKCPSEAAFDVGSTMSVTSRVVRP